MGLQNWLLDQKGGDRERRDHVLPSSSFLKRFGRGLQGVFDCSLAILNVLCDPVVIAAAP